MTAQSAKTGFLLVLTSLSNSDHVNQITWGSTMQKIIDLYMWRTNIWRKN